MEGDVTSSLQAESLRVFPSLRILSLLLLILLQTSCYHPHSALPNTDNAQLSLHHPSLACPLGTL